MIDRYQLSFMLLLMVTAYFMLHGAMYQLGFLSYDYLLLVQALYISSVVMLTFFTARSDRGK